MNESIHNTRYTKTVVVLLVLSGLFSGCFKDTGNYELEYGNSVSITFDLNELRGLQRALLGDEITVRPIVEYSNPTLTAENYDHEWYIGGSLIGTDSILNYVIREVGSFPLSYYMVEKSTGIRFGSEPIPLRVATPNQAGWGILYEKDGKSEIGHIGLSGNNYVHSTDIYKKNNNGEELGSSPYRIKEFSAPGTRGLAIIQGGGEGAVELDGYTFEKQFVVKNSFIGGTPANLEPINMGLYAKSSVLLNADGKLYPRFLPNNSLPFSIPWLNQPLQTPKGMKITHLWDVSADLTGFSFLYDEMNNRILFLRLSESGYLGGVVQVDTLPPPPLNTPFPENHANPNDLGDWQYIWGGTFGDRQLNADAGVLLKHSSSHEFYFQRFSVRFTGLQAIVTPGTWLRFTGGALISAQSVYEAIKSRDYLFFSGGPGNRTLYYYDIRGDLMCKEYVQLDGAITALRQSNNSGELAVGLENGSVVLFDISDPVLISEMPKELYRVDGLGRIADIVFQGGDLR